MSNLKSRIATFLREARRRKVYTAALAYIGLSLVLIQLGEALFQAFLFPPVAGRILTILLLLGFPVVMVLAWVFDIGPAGLLRTDAPAPAHADYAHSGSSWAPPIPDEDAPAAETIEFADETPDPERVRRAALATIRHELRTPINAIIGYGEMLQEDALAEGDSAAAADLERVVAGGRTLLSLIEGILGADRVSADAGRDLESYAAQVRADLRDPLSAVNGYAEMLIESSGEGGHSARLPDLERILSASRKLLDLSNDIVQVGSGAQGEVHGLARASSMAEGVLSKIRRIDTDAHAEERQGSLLVVDDNAMNRDLLARQLARKGYLVATAEHGRQALDRMAEQEFDVVLLDVMMPEMDGIEVLRRMKADARLREVPVIMISALDEIDSVIRCLEIGASDFLSKPFHPTLLDARIGASLAVRRIRQREAQLRAAVKGSESPLDRIAESTLPASVLARLRRGETRVFDASAEATVLWCDVDRAVAARTDPQDRAARIDALCTLVFETARTVGVESVLHRGSGLLLACGFPALANKSAERIAESASLLLERAPAIANAGLRLGLHTGPMYGAVVGGERLSYWVWGEGVDLARRLAGDAEANQAHVSPAAHALLKERFHLTSRGVVDVAGRGQMRTWSLKAPVPQPATS